MEFADRPGRLVAALLMGAAIVVPLIFNLALDDTFTLPKLVGLWMILAVAVVGTILVSGAVAIQQINHGLINIGFG